MSVPPLTRSFSPSSSSYSPKAVSSVRSVVCLSVVGVGYRVTRCVYHVVGVVAAVGVGPGAVAHPG